MEKANNKNIEALLKLGLNKPDFKVPENYFEEFETALFAKTEEEKLPETPGFTVPKNHLTDFENELFAKIATEDLRKSDGFKVPENYFETFETQLTEKLPQKTRKQKYRILNAVASIAAVFLVYFGVYKYQTNNSLDFSSLELTDINAYIAAGNLDIDTYTLASIDTDVNIESVVSDQITAEDVDAYMNSLEPEIIFIDN